MSTSIATSVQPMTPPMALPELPIAVRAATVDDLPFIDALQKVHAKQVGWMPTTQLEGKIAAGQVLVAEEETRRQGDGETRRQEHDSSPCLPVFPSPCLLGYVIGHDQYFKRDDVGIVYQMNIAPGHQRKLVGATLLKALFDRAAYGCRLFCCWCAQDIAANRFWEAMGFVPLAFRAGSEKKARVHIFWQRRIRAGDTTTPWWFPAKTDAGAMREDRLVLPIPPGKHWSDELPALLPKAAGRALPDKTRGKLVPGTRCAPQKPTPKARAGVQFGPPGSQVSVADEEHATPRSKRGKPKREKVKADPKLVAAARELRDRWLERVNEEGIAVTAGKYEVSRAIDGTIRQQPRLLNSSLSCAA